MPYAYFEYFKIRIMKQKMYYSFNLCLVTYIFWVVELVLDLMNVSNISILLDERNVLMKCVRLSVIAVWILHLRDTWVSRYNQSGEEILWTKKRVQFDDLLFTIEGMPLQQTEICITVRRRSWQLLHLCTAHTTLHM